MLGNRITMKGICFSDELKAQRLPLIAHFDAQSGYGTYSVQVALELLKRGYDLKAFSPAWHENLGKIPQEIKNILAPSQYFSNKAFIIWPCEIAPNELFPKAASYAYMTMWETTRISRSIHVLNHARVVMVPCSWNATVFSSCGIKRPIRIVPLCVRTDLFRPSENKIGDAFIFGTAAAFIGGGIRKGLPLVIQAFRMAFPSNNDVRLRVKCIPGDPVPQTGDKRIEVCDRYLTVEDLQKWYSSLNVFVSGSASEGWGRHQHEAMCCGRPVIGINFGGVAEFFNPSNGYPVSWKLVPSEGVYRGVGEYAKPDVQSMAEQMRLAVSNNAEMVQKSILSAKEAHRFTIQNSVDEIVKVLIEFGFL